MVLSFNFLCNLKIFFLNAWELLFGFFLHTEHPYEKESFSVGLDHHFQTSQGEIVRYNDNIVNSNANVYNIQTGKFTAALDGTYIFHYHGLAQDDQVGI